MAAASSERVGLLDREPRVRQVFSAQPHRIAAVRLLAQARQPIYYTFRTAVRLVNDLVFETDIKLEVGREETRLFNRLSYSRLESRLTQVEVSYSPQLFFMIVQNFVKFV